jgi:hypothetical protein
MSAARSRSGGTVIASTMKSVSLWGARVFSI